MNKLPLSIRDVAPDFRASRLPAGRRADGLPDGIHTGGVWLYGGEVWKPLDGRPYVNADFHLPTREAEFLETVADLPSFPRNWRVEEANGRQWLVRPDVYVLEAQEYQHLDTEVLLQVERDIREANRRGWELGDDIFLACGGSVDGFFVLDCSSASYWTPAPEAYEADDSSRIERFFNLAGAAALVRLRHNGRDVTDPLAFEARNADKIAIAGGGQFIHVYASFNRPASLLWMTLGQPAILEQNERGRWDEMIPWTWIITREPIPEETRQRYELMWAWSPIHDPEPEPAVG